MNNLNSLTKKLLFWAPFPTFMFFCYTEGYPQGVFLFFPCHYTFACLRFFRDMGYQLSTRFGIGVCILRFICYFERLSSIMCYSLFPCLPITLFYVFNSPTCICVLVIEVSVRALYVSISLV